MVGITQDLFDKVFTEFLTDHLMKMEDVSAVDVDKLTEEMKPLYLQGFLAGCHVSECILKNGYIPTPSVN